jgi:hypothetical protein
MKYLAIFVVFVFAALMAQAQTNNPTIYTFKQKQLNDSLKMIFPDLQKSQDIPYNDALPVLQLKNEGVKVGSNNMGDIYSMKTDQMPCLKPFTTEDEIPNAISRKQPLPIVLNEKQKH